MQLNWLHFNLRTPQWQTKRFFMVKKGLFGQNVTKKISPFPTDWTFWLLSKPVPSPQHLCLCPRGGSHLFYHWRSWSLQQEPKVQPKNCRFPKFWRPRTINWPLGRATYSLGRQQDWWKVWIQEHPPATQRSSRDEVLQRGFPHRQQSPLAHKSRLWKPTPFHRRRVPIKSQALKHCLERVEPPLAKRLQIFKICNWSVLC